MRTLRDKTDEYKGRETKIKTGRGTKHETHGEQTEGYWRDCGGGLAKWVKGIKECTPEIIVSLYAN